MMYCYATMAGILMFPFPFVSNFAFGVVVTVGSVLASRITVRVFRVVNRVLRHLCMSSAAFMYCTMGVLRGFTWRVAAPAKEFVGADNVLRIPASAVLASLSLPGKVVAWPLIEALTRGAGFGFVILYSILWGFVLVGASDLLLFAIKKGITRFRPPKTPDDGASELTDSPNQWGGQSC
jgi:hypothetical protein